jgi:hypothetical protein
MTWSRMVFGLGPLLVGFATACAAGDTSENFDAAPTFDAVVPPDSTLRDRGAPSVESGFPSLDTGGPTDAGSEGGQPSDAADTGSPPSEGGADVVAPSESGVDSGCNPMTSHLCGATCTTNPPNSPDMGCSMGCGTVCMPPANGTTTCTDAGSCDFVCDPNFAKMGTTCTQTSQCSTPADCTNLGFQNTLCTNGSCTGCVANFGDCDGNPANGCETNLTTTDNCGFCGDSCDTGFAGGCGFLGLGGQSCDQGTPFQCGC